MQKFFIGLTIEMNKWPKLLLLRIQIQPYKATQCGWCQWKFLKPANFQLYKRASIQTLSVEFWVWFILKKKVLYGQLSIFGIINGRNKTIKMLALWFNE